MARCRVERVGRCLGAGERPSSGVEAQVVEQGILELRPDGIAVMNGDQAPWSVAGNTLAIGSEAIPFAAAGDLLRFSMGGVELDWQRISGGQGMPDSASGSDAPPLPLEATAALPFGASAQPAVCAPGAMTSGSAAPPATPAESLTPNQGGDPAGAWDSAQGTLLLRPDGTGRAGGEEMHWAVQGATLAFVQGGRWVRIPLTAARDQLLLGSGPVVCCRRAGIADVWIGSESSLDPSFYMSFSQTVTLFPDGSVGYSKSESGATRSQVSEQLERFRYFNERGPGVQSIGRWQSDGRRIVVQFNFRPDPVEGWVDLENFKMQLNGMGKLPANEGGPVNFERQ